MDETAYVTYSMDSRTCAMSNSWGDGWTRPDIPDGWRLPDDRPWTQPPLMPYGPSNPMYPAEGGPYTRPEPIVWPSVRPAPVQPVMPQAPPVPRLHPQTDGSGWLDVWIHTYQYTLIREQLLNVWAVGQLTMYEISSDRFLGVEDLGELYANGHTLRIRYASPGQPDNASEPQPSRDKPKKAKKVPYKPKSRRIVLDD